MGKKITAAHNEFLKEVKSLFNRKIFAATSSVLNREGQDRAVEYLKGFTGTDLNQLKSLQTEKGEDQAKKTESEVNKSETQTPSKEEKTMAEVKMGVIKTVGREMQELMDCGPEPIRFNKVGVKKADLVADIKREAVELEAADEADFSKESWAYLKDSGFLPDFENKDKKEEVKEEEVVEEVVEEKKKPGKKKSTKKEEVVEGGDEVKDEEKKKPTKKPVKKSTEKKYSRWDALIAAAKEGGTKEEQVKLAAQLYTDNTGKKVNVSEANWLYNTVQKAVVITGKLVTDSEGVLGVK